jgi:hypothetical protein
MVVLIDFDFKVLDEIITTAKDSDVPAALKLKNDAKEVGLALLGEIVGLKLPSVKNCKERIGIYRVKITEFEKKVVELGPKIVAMIDANTTLAKEIETMPVRVTADAVKKAELKSIFQDKAAPELTALMDRVADLNVEIVKGHKAAGEYAKRLKVLEESKHTATDWASVMFSMGIDAALNINAVEEALEKGLEAIIALENAAMDLILENTE